MKLIVTSSADTNLDKNLPAGDSNGCWCSAA